MTQPVHAGVKRKPLDYLDGLALVGGLALFVPAAIPSLQKLAGTPAQPLLGLLLIVCGMATFRMFLRERAKHPDVSQMIIFCYAFMMFAVGLAYVSDYFGWL